MTRFIRPLSLALPLALAAACSTGDVTPTSPSATAAQAVAPAVAPVCLEFNVPPIGAVFGAPSGVAPGTFVFAENGISVTTRRLFDAFGAPFYNFARVEPGVGWLAGDPSGHNLNIALQFGFGGLPFVPAQVDIDYHDGGGFENLTFNGTPLRVGQLDALGGGAVAVAWWWAGANKEGRVSITGPVNNVTIGGQDLWIDSVCAFP